MMLVRSVNRGRIVISADFSLSVCINASALKNIIIPVRIARTIGMMRLDFSVLAR